MDEMVLKVQNWLNLTYKGRPGYNQITADGQTGNATFKALIKALQIECGMTTIDGSFGDATIAAMKSKFPTVSEVADPNTAEEKNIHALIQGALWCKGYNPGGFTGIFGPKTTASVKIFQADAGITQDGIVRPYILQGMMNTDGYSCNSTSGELYYKHMAAMFLNQYYGERIGLTAPSGLWERKAHKNLIKACQIEWGITIDGVFGNGAYNAAPTLSINTSGWTASKRLLQAALAINGFWPGGITGTFGAGTKQAVTDFQEFLCLGADGVAGKNTWASLLKSCGYSGRSTTACDTAVQLTIANAQTLKGKGYDTVGRYLTKVSGGMDKNLTASEIANLAAAGLKVFPIYQTIGNSASYFSRSQGTSDGSVAKIAARRLGFPSGTVIYFAVDYDVLTAEISSKIIPYFRGIKTYIGEYKVGVYAPRAVCSALSNLNLAEKSFVADMSSGFTGNIGEKMPSNWAYEQIAETSVEGIGIDKVVASPRATAVLASSLNPQPEITPDPYCGGDNHTDVTLHESWEIGLFNMICPKCGYSVPRPESQDPSLITNDLDKMKLQALQYAAAHYAMVNANGEGDSSPAQFWEHDKYYLPHMMMKLQDDIRMGYSGYSFSDGNGTYARAYKDYYAPIMDHLDDYSTTFNVIEINNEWDVWVQSGALEDFCFSVFGVLLNIALPGLGAFYSTLQLFNDASSSDLILAGFDALDKVNALKFGVVGDVLSIASTAWSLSQTKSVLAPGDTVIRVMPTKCIHSTENINKFMVNCVFDSNQKYKYMSVGRNIGSRDANAPEPDQP